MKSLLQIENTQCLLKAYSLLDDKKFQKKLIKVKQSKNYPLMIALSDIIIDAFLLSNKKTTNNLSSKKVLAKGGDVHGQAI